MTSLSTLQHLQMNDWLALCRLPFTQLHRLWIHFLQPWHKIELLPAPFLHTPPGHLPSSSTLSFILQLNITFVFPIFIFKPFASNPDFHFTILSCRQDSKMEIRVGSKRFEDKYSSSVVFTCLMCRSSVKYCFAVTWWRAFNGIFTMFVKAAGIRVLMYYHNTYISAVNYSS